MATDKSRRVGANIRRRREELNLTQKQVAGRMPSGAVDGQRISDWERGVNEPSERYMQELAQALTVPDVSYFYAPQPTEAQESPDLMGALSDATQLDRIEAKLDELLRRSGPAPAEAIEQEMRDAARRARVPAADSEPSARGRRRQRRSS